MKAEKLRNKGRRGEDVGHAICVKKDCEKRKDPSSGKKKEHHGGESNGGVSGANDAGEKRLKQRYLRKKTTGEKKKTSVHKLLWGEERGYELGWGGSQWSRETEKGGGGRPKEKV